MIPVVFVDVVSAKILKGYAKVSFSFKPPKKEI
jgi:hypothetical protein